MSKAANLGCVRPTVLRTREPITIRHSKPVEFDGIRMHADSNCSEFATIRSHLDLPDFTPLQQGERLTKLNAIAIRQMKTLAANASRLLEAAGGRTNDEG